MPSEEAPQRSNTGRPNAIEARTGLKLEAETEEQAQTLADLKLARETDRAARQRELERVQAEHRMQLERIAHEEALRHQAADREQENRGRRETNAVELERVRAFAVQRMEFLRTLQAMQVDLTRYWVAQYQKPDRLIRIDGDGKGGKPQLHLHDN